MFLNEYGKVSEGPGSCFFMVRNNRIVTPKFTDAVLESITRDTVIRLARNLGIKVEERTIDRTELYTADEAFLCGSAMELTPLLSIDRYDLGEAKISQNLHEAYLEVVSGKNKDLYRLAYKDILIGDTNNENTILSAFVYIHFSILLKSKTRGCLLDALP